MKGRSVLIGGSYWIGADSLYIFWCGSAGLDHSDGESYSQSFSLQLIQPCVDNLWL